MTDRKHFDFGLKPKPGTVVKLAPGDDTSPIRTFYLRLADEEEAQGWAQAIREIRFDYVSGERDALRSAKACLTEQVRRSLLPAVGPSAKDASAMGLNKLGGINRASGGTVRVATLVGHRGWVHTKFAAEPTPSSCP